MALKPLLSFSGGELDPILHDNVTLEKFNKGLATCRNALIGKTGTILSRFSRQYVASAKNADEKIKVYYPPNSGQFLEIGTNYLRVHTLPDEVFSLTQAYIGGSMQVELALPQTYSETELDSIHFDNSGDYVYIFCASKKMLKLHLSYGASTFVADADVFKVPPPGLSISVVQSHDPETTPGWGFPAYQYASTVVIDGEESLMNVDTNLYVRPATSGPYNTITIVYPGSEEITEARIYARPAGGGAFGLLGVTTTGTYDAVDDEWTITFIDYGSTVDFTLGEQEIITARSLQYSEIIDLKPRTGAIYQGRLLITTDSDKEALLASRPNYQNNFYRDYPYSLDSALQFKAGTSGKADVLRVIEQDGLIVFTTIGVFVNAGLLSVDNLALQRKSKVIIKVDVPPLVVPGGLFFVDTENVIRQLVYSQDILSYEIPEQTIFSNHLFKKRTIKSWCYQGGLTPVIIVSFSDGKFATFTYNSEHQMRAWTRHDTKYPVEQVEGTDVLNRSLFVINKDGQRYIEVTVPRFVTPDIYAEEYYGEYDKFVMNTYMDGVHTIMTRLNDIFDVDEHYIIAPVVADTWDGQLTISSSSGSLGFLPTVGQILRFFNPDDGSEINLEVISFNTSVDMIVQPSEEFPSEYAESARLYKTYNEIIGLDHLEGEEVSVMVDGYVVSSPYNSQYATLTVTGGIITLPNGMFGSIIHVGRPIVGDVKTLPISTVEQSPTLIESVNVNKLDIKINETRGLYISNRFPEEKDDEVDGTSITGMEDIHKLYVPENGELIGNRFDLPVSRRIQKTVPGHWDSNGQLAIRQVDPVPFEIISIIPDATVLKRSDR